MPKLTRNLVSSQKLFIFSQVAECKSITAAAKKLCMTQPAVSNVIKQLEGHFSTKLIEIIGKKLSLTQAGDNLYAQWQHIASCYESMYQQMESLKLGLTGHLRIGMVSTAKYFVPRIINQYLQKYPHVEFTCEIYKRQQLLEVIESQHCDLAVLTEQDPQDERFDCMELGVNPLVFIASNKHHLAGKQAIEFSEIEQEKFIAREPDAIISRYLQHIFHMHQATPDLLFEIDSTEAIKQSVIHDLGIALVPKMSVEREIRHREVVILDIDDIQLITRWHIYLNKNPNRSVLLDNFTAFMAKSFSSNAKQEFSIPAP